jgi:hypothetical protein
MESVMSRFANSWTLAKESMAVLRQDKELAAIPVASAAACAAIALAFGGAAYFSLDQVANPGPDQDAFQATPLTYAVGVVGLFFVGIAAQYFAAVLVAGANERLEGGNPSLGSAMAKANTRFPAVVGWAAMNVTVGLLLSAVRDRAGFLGDIAASLFGAAWNVITWLAVPVIVVEGTGPVAGVKRSAHLLKQTWGENLIGVVGLLALLPGLVLFGLVSVVVPIVGIPLLVVYVAVVSAVLAALGGIFRTALYRYAVGLPNGGVFPEQVLAGAFRQKGQGRTQLFR